MCIVFIFQSQEQGCFCLAFLSFFSFSILLKNKIKTQKTCQNEVVTTFNRAHRVQRVLFAKNRALFCRFAISLKKVYELSFFFYVRVSDGCSVFVRKRRRVVCLHTIRVHERIEKRQKQTACANMSSTSLFFSVTEQSSLN